MESVTRTGTRMMTTRTGRFLQGLSASVIVAGALLLPASSMLAARHGAGVAPVVHLADGAEDTSPVIFHHWPHVDGSVAEIDPAIFHHWSGAAVRVADDDPDIFHHWASVAGSVAEIDPAIFHHWSGAAVRVADDDPDIFHHWG